MFLFLKQNKFFMCLGLALCLLQPTMTFAQQPTSQPAKPANVSRMPSSKTAILKMHWHKDNFAAALSAASAQKKLVFLDMYATWCYPCKKYVSKVFPKPEVIEFLSRNFISLKRDGYKGEGRTLAKRYNCVTYPCLLVINSKGKEVDRITRYMKAEPFLARLKQIKNGKETLAALLPQLKANPKDAVLHYRIGRRYAYRGNVKCVQHLRYVVTNPPSQYPWLAPKALYVLGRIYYRNTKRNWKKAAAIFQEYLKKYPQHRKAARVQRMLEGCLRRIKR